MNGRIALEYRGNFFEKAIAFWTLRDQRSESPRAVLIHFSAIGIFTYGKTLRFLA